MLQLKGEPGYLGLASQSGIYATQTLPYLRRKGIRFSKAISVGNRLILILLMPWNTWVKTNILGRSPSISKAFATAGVSWRWRKRSLPISR